MVGIYVTGVQAFRTCRVRRFRRSNWGVEFRCQEFCVEDCLMDWSYDRVVLKIGGEVM